MNLATCQVYQDISPRYVTLQEDAQVVAFARELVDWMIRRGRSRRSRSSIWSRRSR